MFCPLPKTAGFHEKKSAKILIVHSTYKSKGFAPQTLEIDENNENSRCHPGEMTVCQKHNGFDKPEIKVPLVACPF